MREIKFRAWDNLERKMYPVRKIEYSIDNETILYVWVNSELVRDNKSEYGGKYIGDYRLHYPERCNLMQYTGLKEKNGKEIYEGDIYIAKGLDGKHIIEWDNEEQLWSFVRHQDDTGIYNKEGMEVIGNIYEDKELLRN